MVCRTWSLQAGVNASGLCSFGLLPETANPTSSCVLCVSPIDTRIPDCGCFAPEVAREILYITVNKIADTFLSDCVMNSFLGTHALTGKCGAGGGNNEQINYFSSIFDPPRECEEVSNRPNIGMLWTGYPIGPLGARRAGVRVSFYYTQMITGGALPGPQSGQLACAYAGGAPWCSGTRGSSVLSYAEGPAGNCFSVSVSTEPP